MHLALVTDARRPQVNGVVTTLARTLTCLEALGYRVSVISPEGRFTLACPTCPEMRLALLSGFSLSRELDKLQQSYPNVIFAGYRFGDELAAYLSSAAVFVFPSRTDIFGLVSSPLVPSCLVRFVDPAEFA